MSDELLQLELTLEEREFIMALIAEMRPASQNLLPGKRLDLQAIPEDEFENYWHSVDDKLRNADADMTPYTAGDLLLASRGPLKRLRDLGIVRSANAPAGDFAEWLVAKAVEGELAGQSQKGWDVATKDGKHIQVKARFVSNPIRSGQRHLSTFRSFDFDELVIVLLDDTSPVARAVCIPRDEVELQATPNEYVGGKRVNASDALLARGEDWTERLQTVATMHLDNYIP